MLKTIKKKGEKLNQKLDFRLQLHATRVPQTGWDKLVVSLIPPETGKASTRTSKAAVQNGTCRWPDAILETTTLIQDSRLKVFEEKFYKLHVTSGYPRGTVLGEATVNIAEYAGATSPTSVSLPLRNCYAGTILHIKIQCLSSSGTRGSDDHLADPNHMSASEEDIDDPDFSTAGSGTSAAGGRLVRNSSRDSAAASHCSSEDSSDISSPRTSGRTSGNSRTFSADVLSSTTCTNSRKEHQSGRAKVGSSHEASRYRSSPVQSARTLVSLQRSSQYTKGGPHDSFSQDVEQPKSTNGGPQVDMISYVDAITHAQRLELDVKDLKEQLEEQKRKQCERSAEVTALADERDRLALEIDNLRSAKQARGLRFDAVKLHSDDSKRIIKGLQEELASVKGENYDLTIRLQRTEQSNMDFMVALEELDKSLAEQRTELESAMSENQHLQASLLSAKEQEHALNRKIAQEESEMRVLQEKIIELQSSQKKPVKHLEADEGSSEHHQKEVDNLKRDIEELEKDCKELTEENLDLIFKLKKANEEHARNNVLSSTMDGDIDYEELERVRSHAHDLEKKVKEMEEFYAGQCSTNASHISDLQTLIQGLTTTISELESQNEKYNEEIHTMEVEIESLRSKSEQEKEEYVSAHQKIMELSKQMQKMTEQFDKALEEKDKLETDAEAIKVQKLELERNITILEADNHEQKANIEDLLQQIASQAGRFGEMESSINHLQMVKGKLEKRVHNLQQHANLDVVQKETTLQLSALQEKFDLINASKEELEVEVTGLKAEKEMLSKMFSDSQEASKQEIGLLENELNSLKHLEIDLRTQLEEISQIKDNLMHQISQVKEEGERLAERNTDLERHLICCMEEKEAYRFKNAELEIHAIELVNKNNDIRNELEALRARVLVLETNKSDLEERCKVYNESKEKFELEIKQMEDEAAGHLENIKALEGHIKDLQITENELRNQLQITDLKHSSSVSSLALVESEVSRLEMELDKRHEEYNKETGHMNTCLNEAIEKAAKFEQLHEQTCVEKLAVISQLENKIQHLMQQISLMQDEKERLYSEAQAKAMEFQAGKKEWDGKLINMEQRVEEAELLVRSMKVECDARIQDYLNDCRRLEDEQHELTTKYMEAEKAASERKKSWESWVDDIQKQLKIINREKMKLAEENEDMRMKVLENELLKAESDAYKATLESIKMEKQELEAFLEGCDSANKALKEEIQEKVAIIEKMLAEIGLLKCSKDDLENRLGLMQSKLNQQEIAWAQEIEQSGVYKLKLTKKEQENKLLEEKIKKLQAELHEKHESSQTGERKLKDRGKNESSKTFNAASMTSRSPNRFKGTSPSRDAKEKNDLSEKIKYMETEIKARNSEMEFLKEEFKQKEVVLNQKIEYLEKDNEQDESKFDQLQNELTRLQKEIAILTNDKHELLLRLGTHELLEKEVQKLQEENQLVEGRMTKLKASSKCVNFVERVANLETELAEALEANNMYKLQLRSAFAQQENIHPAAKQNDVELDIQELLEHKKKAALLETELQEMHDRYLDISLRFAQVEAERGELIMIVRQLKNGKK